MAQVEILLPSMGESVAEATVTKWMVSEGDVVEQDDTIVEIATDKVDSEVPAPQDGTIIKVLCAEGDVVQVGAPIAIIEIEGEGAPVASSPQVEATPEVAKAAEKIETTVSAAVETVNFSSDGDNGFLSPLVKSIVKTENITQTELDAINGTGRDGRITKDDIMAFLEGGRKAPSKPAAAKAAAKPASKAPAPAVAMGSGDTIIEMDRMRKIIADHMVNSKQTSPHVTSFVEADVTNIVNWRNKIKNKFLAQEGEKITFTPIFIEAIAKAIREFPDINVSVKDGTHIVKKSNVNIGMAAALPSGNLIVPVIKNADQLNLVGLTKAVNDLGKRAKANKLLPDEIQGGTYTMTNLGSFGNVFGTPIINQPQAAIMGVGAIVKKPAVITTEHGDVIAIRHFMMLSHAYDHRVVDGFLGGSFVKRVAELLESFDPNREI
jgi:2-oxoglutarate dehydrogenase E2 component (dihydrolipoamide succinyltransferase)